jgi:hypothetical protein
MLKWTKTKKNSQIGFAQSKQLWKLKSLALALLPTENQIFMACLDAHLYEIEYTCKIVLIIFDIRVLWQNLDKTKGD